MEIAAVERHDARNAREQAEAAELQIERYPQDSLNYVSHCFPVIRLLLCLLMHRVDMISISREYRNVLVQKEAEIGALKQQLSEATEKLERMVRIYDASSFSTQN